MRSTFVYFPPKLDIFKASYWEYNPQHKLLFKEVIDKYKTKSSTIMWAIALFSHPDESISLLYRLPVEERKQTIKANYAPTIDWEDPFIEDLINKWEYTALDTVTRILKNEKDSLVKRDEFLRTQEYDFDTMALLDAAKAKTPKLWENYEVVAKKYIEAHGDNGQIFGGRRESISEQRKL